MSDNSSWYAKRFAQLRGGSPAPVQARVLADIPYRPIPQAQPQVVQQQPMRDVAPTPPVGAVTIHNFAEAMGWWKGGKGQQEQDPCPRCGRTLWSRSEGVRRGPPPAPLCYHCGYNGMESNWG